MAFYFKINGTDITRMIAQKGIKWQRNDIDSAKAGRTLDGTMHRGRVCTKIKLEVKCCPQTHSELYTVLNLIQPEFVTVEYIDPLYGPRRAVFYSNNVPATCVGAATDGTILYDEVSFPLVER